MVRVDGNTCTKEFMGDSTSRVTENHHFPYDYTAVVGDDGDWEKDTIGVLRSPVPTSFLLRVPRL